MVCFYSVDLHRTIWWCRLLIFLANFSRAYTQKQKPVICNPTTELPKVYPILSLHPGESELPEEIINATSQNPESILSWSKLIFQSCNVHVEFTCNATYPIEWVEHYDQKFDQLMSTTNNIAKTLWTDRIINRALLEYSNTHNRNGTNSLINIPSTSVYTSFLGLKYKLKSFCIAANYTCRSVQNVCLQSTVISIVDKENETIRYEQSKHNNYDIEDWSSQNDTCETTLEVSLKDDDWRVGWKCKSPPGKTQNLLLPYSRTCDAAIHCNSYFTHYKKNCVKRLPDIESHCHGCWYNNMSAGYLRHAGFVWCENEDNEILALAHYFFSVPQTIGNSLQSDLYLHWDEADPQKMLYLEPLPTNVYVGETKHIICKVSRYYFSYGHRFGFEYQNGTIHYTDSMDGTHDLSQNVNRMNVTMTFVDQTLNRIYCFAPVWNSTVWINQSINVKLKSEGTLSPYFGDNENLSPTDHEEKITFDLHQRNASLSCHVGGEPTPNIKWIFDASDNETEQVEIEPGRKDLVFHYVKTSTQGKYICEAINFLGSATKVFSVSVRDKHSDLVEITSIVGTIFVLTFIVLLGIGWMKVRMQRNQLRALTDAEVIEFREGNLEILENQEYLDTQELLQALPYNDEYEIPSKYLYIDTSEVLGSGNFGQVLKGVISDSHARGKCNIVAVKTTKPKQDATYFQTLLTEVKIMAYIGQHINVVSLVGACTKNIKNRQIYIAVEYCSKGSLDNFLKRNRSSFINLVRDDSIYITTSFSDTVKNHTYENFSDAQDAPLSVSTSTIHLLKWSREIANGMDFLGSKKIVHGDLAARNILLTDNLIAKIGDFGLSRVLMNYSNYIRSTQDDCLLPWAWLAPETLQELKFSAMSDVWSYGVTIWEIFSLAQHPYPGATYNTAFIEWLKHGHRLHKPSCANSQIYNLMMDCWSLEPSHRMTFSELKDCFEGLLLQCSGDYVYTKSDDTTQYINGSHNLRVHNPGYAVFGKGGLFTENESDSDTQTFATWIYDSSEDRLGYLKPLMLGFENNMQEEVI